MRIKTSLAVTLAGLALVAAPAMAQKALPADAYLEAELALYNGKVRTACRLWTALAETGHPAAQTDAGHCLKSGAGGTEDKSQALAWYHKSAAQGYVPAYLALGKMYRDGNGVERDPAAAADWFARAHSTWQARAEAGDPEAQTGLGRMYLEGPGVTKDVAMAVKWYHKAAVQGYNPAEYAISQLYKFGDDGVPEDDVLVLKWLRKAAEHGNVHAQVEMAMLYDDGDSDGVPEDKVIAAAWFAKAAQLGDASSQKQLGMMYLEGTGVPQDAATAAAWLLKAAVQEDADAQLALAGLYAEGHGVSRNDTAAANWYRQAADQGKSEAQYALGKMYMTGLGVPVDLTAAYKWLTLASKKSWGTSVRADAIEALGRVSFMMTPERIAEGQAQVQAWRTTSQTPQIEARAAPSPSTATSQ